MAKLTKKETDEINEFIENYLLETNLAERDIDRDEVDTIVQNFRDAHNEYKCWSHIVGTEKKAGIALEHACDQLEQILKV